MQEFVAIFCIQNYSRTSKRSKKFHSRPVNECWVFSTLICFERDKKKHDKKMLKGLKKN
jgi:hypothetical protein